MGGCVSSPGGCVGRRERRSSLSSPSPTKRARRPRRRFGRRRPGATLSSSRTAPVSAVASGSADERRVGDRSVSNPAFQGFKTGAFWWNTLIKHFGSLNLLFSEIIVSNKSDGGSCEDVWFESSTVYDSDCDEDFHSVQEDALSLNGCEGASRSSFSSLKDVNPEDPCSSLPVNHEKVQRGVVLSAGNSPHGYSQDNADLQWKSDSAKPSAVHDEASSVSVDGLTSEIIASQTSEGNIKEEGWMGHQERGSVAGGKTGQWELQNPFTGDLCWGQETQFLTNRRGRGSSSYRTHHGICEA
ncbi:hypothetical protein QJS04_geneDACA019999 [Acorus gramineus]|uniref:Uncharacterized protein n=1 Tax=Acorus gramineus TaxID=55184 RepID=A0AAV9A6Y2_ACOGR|nr:hypothetical protein QJS04_geneDACA019999 [Acorus gramineus]